MPTEPAESIKGQELSDEAAERVLATYEQTFVFPTVKPRPQMILCPVGLVGAGKTTVVKPLSEQLSLLRVSTDEIRKILKENGFNYLRTKELALRLIGKYAQQGYSIAIDADCAGHETRSKATALAERLPATLIWIHINPPESFILAKLRAFKHTWLFKDGEEAIQNYQARKPLHEDLNVPFAWTFDTSAADLPEQIEAAITHIKKVTGWNADSGM